MIDFSLNSQSKETKMKRVFSIAIIIGLSIFLTNILLAENEPKYDCKVKMAVNLYEYYLKKNGYTPGNVHAHSIGQSHIDAAWRWRKAQTHLKVFTTYGQAVEHMKTHPEFMFSGSSPQFYEWLLLERPEIFSEIVKREKEGRWEIVGGMWIEPDSNMPDGESFARQCLLGQRFYFEHFGHIAEIAWLLDSFGFNRNMPQILARSGSKYMWTNKPTWNDTTVFPFHNFWWQGPDGSRVLTNITMHSPLPAYFPIYEFKKYTDTRYLLNPGQSLTADYTTPPDTILKYLSNERLDEIGFFFGAGDGGNGPRELEIQIQEGLAAKGYTKFTTARNLFDDIEKKSDRFPVWNDEIYLEFHRGVFTTQAWVKKANRQTERDLRNAETLYSMLHVFGVDYPYAKLKDVWKLGLFQQFHDIIPGSSIPEVYADAKEDYAKIDAALADMNSAAMTDLAGLIDTRPPAEGMTPFVVFNSLPWARSGNVSIAKPDSKAYKVMDAAGAVIAAEISTDGNSISFRAQDVPSMGWRVYFMAPANSTGDKGTSRLLVSEQGGSIKLSNELVSVQVNKITGLIDAVRMNGVEQNFIAGAANKLLLYHDRSRIYSAWDIETDYQKHPLKVGTLRKVEINDAGSLSKEIVVTREDKIQGRTTSFVQRIRLLQGDPVIYLDIDADFNVHDSLLKLEFNTSIDSDAVASDAPYVVVERPTHPKTPAEKARWEMPCHKWIDISDGAFGLTLLNNGKYGFSLTPDGKGYRMTLIKGARHPRPSLNATDVNHPSIFVDSPFTDQGKHHIELGLYPHAGAWRDAKLWRSGYEFNTPLETVVVNAREGKLPQSGSFISIDSDSVYIGSIKRAEDDGDIVIRLVEATGKTGVAKLNFGMGIKVVSAVETDLIEFNPKPIPCGESTIEFEVGPYQIRTLKIKLTR